MKTNFLQKNRSRVSYKKRIIIVVSIFIFGAVIFSFSQGFFVNMFSSFWRGENAVSTGLGNLKNFFKSKDVLIMENQALKQKISSNEITIMYLQTVLGTENTLLENLGREETKEFVGASVLVHPPRTPYDSLIIDIGSRQGISSGSEVYLPEGPKIGIVEEIWLKNSRVKLYSSNGENTNAVLERNSVPVVLVGRGGGNFEIELPRDVEAEIGDKVLSSDLSQDLIGVVGDIQVAPTDSFKKVIVNSVASVYSLRFVVVRP